MPQPVLGASGSVTGSVSGEDMVWVFCIFFFDERERVCEQNLLAKIMTVISL
jgi:hypothetical protein